MIRSLRISKCEPVHESTEYEGLGLPQLEAAVAQLQARLEEAQREHRHARIEKVKGDLGRGVSSQNSIPQFHTPAISPPRQDAATGAYRRLEGQLTEAKAALAREAQAAEGLGWRHKLELRAYGDKATALQHHHERRLGQVAEERARLLADAGAEQQQAGAQWAARAEAAREDSRALVASGAASLGELEVAQREELAALRRELGAELQELKADGLDRLAWAAHALALRHKVEAHALEERRDQHLHDLLVAHQCTVQQMRGYYAGIVAEQAARIDGLEVSWRRVLGVGGSDGWTSMWLGLNRVDGSSILFPFTHKARGGGAPGQGDRDAGGPRPAVRGARRDVRMSH